MPYYWSENARIGLRFLSAWNREHAIPEQEILKAEKALNCRFPETLRHFYLDWGNYFELTKTRANIYRPWECKIRTNHLMISEENQWVYSHGIELLNIQDPNPSVEYVVNGGKADDWLLSHERVSDHLDGILFGHAFASRRLSGAYGCLLNPDQGDSHEILLGIGFSKIVLKSNVLGIFPEFGSEWPMYYNHSAIVSLYPTGIVIKAQSRQSIDALDALMDIKWDDRW